MELQAFFDTYTLYAQNNPQKMFSHVDSIMSITL